MTSARKITKALKDFARQTFSGRVNPEFKMIVVLGVDHCLQLPPSTGGLWAGVEQIPKAQAQRLGFRAKIEELITTHGCGFIGEETNQGQLTPARDVATQHGLTHHNIDMSQAKRAALEIPPGYQDDQSYSSAQKQAWNQLREQYMTGQIHAQRGTTQNLLIICGLRHMVALRNALGLQEQAIQVDVTQEAWFSGPLQTHWLFE